MNIDFYGFQPTKPLSCQEKHNLLSNKNRFFLVALKSSQPKQSKQKSLKSCPIKIINSSQFPREEQPLKASLPRNILIKDLVNQNITANAHYKSIHNISGTKMQLATANTNLCTRNNAKFLLKKQKNSCVPAKEGRSIKQRQKCRCHRKKSKNQNKIQKNEKKQTQITQRTYQLQNVPIQPVVHQNQSPLRISKQRLQKTICKITQGQLKIQPLIEHLSYDCKQKIYTFRDIQKTPSKQKCQQKSQQLSLCLKSNVRQKTYKKSKCSDSICDFLKNSTESLQQKEVILETVNNQKEQHQLQNLKNDSFQISLTKFNRVTTQLRQSFLLSQFGVNVRSSVNKDQLTIKQSEKNNLQVCIPAKKPCQNLNQQYFGLQKSNKKEQTSKIMDLTKFKKSKFPEQNKQNERQIRSSRKTERPIKASQIQFSDLSSLSISRSQASSVVKFYFKPDDDEPVPKTYRPASNLQRLSSLTESILYQEEQRSSAQRIRTQHYI